MFIWRPRFFIESRNADLGQYTTMTIEQWEPLRTAPSGVFFFSLRKLFNVSSNEHFSNFLLLLIGYVFWMSGLAVARLISTASLSENQDHALASLYLFAFGSGIFKFSSINIFSLAISLLLVLENDKN